MSVAKVRVRNGRFEEDEDRQKLSTTIKAWADDDKKPLVVHFHGGLVSKKVGTAIADTLAPFYEGAGADAVFFIWQSGWDETIKYNLPQIVSAAVAELDEGKVLRWLMKKAIKLAARKLGIPGDLGLMGIAPGGADPLPDEVIADDVDKRFDYIAQDLAGVAPAISAPQHEPFERATAQADRTVAPTAELQVEVTNDVEAELKDDPEWSQIKAAQPTGISPATLFKIGQVIVRVTMNTIRRFHEHRDHGLYHTVLEEVLETLHVGAIGRLLQWDRMKEDTADAFAEVANAGSALARQVAEVLAKSPQRQVVLVGHSTGAVYICNFLKYAQDILPPNSSLDVVFLAPACTFDLFHETLAKARSRIRSLRIFAMQDSTECADRVAPPIYTRSLLYLVSGLLESERDKPLLGMERFHVSAAYSGDPSVVAVKTELAKIPNWGVWSVTDDAAVAGLRSSSKSHGGFDDDLLTLRSIESLLTSRVAPPGN